MSRVIPFAASSQANLPIDDIFLLSMAQLHVLAIPMGEQILQLVRSQRVPSIVVGDKKGAKS